VKIDKKSLEKLHARYNLRRFVHPDPLELLYSYDDPLDREIVGLVASSLAYGRVEQILTSARAVLDRMPSPARFLARSTRKSLRAAFQGFKHRFTTGRELADVLFGMKKALEEHGSLHACFLAGLSPDHENVLPALSRFVSSIQPARKKGHFHLLPDPEQGSACKRLNLYLRWMVRSDRVDPGGWNEVDPRLLIVPVDTHMHRIGRMLGMTGRAQADLKTALEMTAAFRSISPEDPVRYDFCLTRLGILGLNDLDKLIGIQSKRRAAGA
jgi:uncharacterized protein (TIGR02757 family)